MLLTPSFILDYKTPERLNQARKRNDYFRIGENQLETGRSDLKPAGGTGRLNPVRNVKSIGLPSGRPGLFHGYWIVVATFACLFIFSGLGYYAFGFFVTPIQSDLGWDRADIMAAFTVFFLVQGLVSPLMWWAVLYDR